MNDFDREMNRHQVQWRGVRGHVETTTWGTQNGKEYEWILPPKEWEQGLWSDLRTGTNASLKGYLTDNKIQKHIGAHNLKSSWILCANLYFPFRASEEGRNLLASFLREHVDPSIETVDDLQLEYAEDPDSPLHPSPLLGETGGGRGAGQTSPDIAFLVNGGRGLILTENKFVEHSFYPCSARRRTGSGERPTNPAPERCNDPTAVLNDPALQCQQVTWKRRYWDHLAPVIDPDRLGSLRCCPAAYGGYQLFRQQALAEGIAVSDKYELVVSCLAIDDRNETLKRCLKSTGINDIRDWGNLFNGRAHFAVFTHQQWIAWVKGQDVRESWSDWLNYVGSRYGLKNST